MGDVMIYLGSDHAGFKVKERIKRLLARKGIPFEDLGPAILYTTDDYPDYAKKVAQKVSKTKGNFGILVCGTGTGMAIAANKIKGIRAAFAFDGYSAVKAREDNDANILVVRGRKFSFFRIRRIVSLFLRTPFSTEERHLRRIKKIGALEK